MLRTIVLVVDTLAKGEQLQDIACEALKEYHVEVLFASVSEGVSDEAARLGFDCDVDP